MAGRQARGTRVAANRRPLNSEAQLGEEYRSARLCPAGFKVLDLRFNFAYLIDLLLVSFTIGLEAGCLPLIRTLVAKVIDVGVGQCRETQAREKLVHCCISNKLQETDHVRWIIHCRPVRPVLKK